MAAPSTDINITAQEKRKIANKKYYEKNRERILESKKTEWWINRDESIEKQKAYRQLKKKPKCDANEKDFIEQQMQALKRKYDTLKNKLDAQDTSK